MFRILSSKLPRPALTPYLRPVGKATPSCSRPSHMDVVNGNNAGGRATHGAVAEAFNTEAGYSEHKVRVHDLIRGSLMPHEKILTGQ